MKERQAIEEAERIKRKAFESTNHPVPIDKDKLPLNILERKVRKVEGSNNYDQNNYRI